MTLFVTHTLEKQFFEFPMLSIGGGAASEGGGAAQTVYDKIKPLNAPVSSSAPTAHELSATAVLDKWCVVNVPLGDAAHMRKREQVLHDLTSILQGWVRQTYLDKGFPADVADQAGGAILTSGSHRLGVNDPTSDIDTICVVPRECLLEDFFNTLHGELEAHPDVTELNKVEGAAVPLLTFELRGIEIDLLFARLGSSSVPPDELQWRINDDSVLANVDKATTKALNGPRVTNLFEKLVPPQAWDNFLVMLRVLRKWAKARGVWKNKFGYPGGVNYSIMAAFVCQLYPNATSSVQLAKFFFVFSQWNWPMPIHLTPMRETAPGMEHDVWACGDWRDVMPVITPAYPAMNSMFAASQQTLSVLTEEMKRANEIVKRLVAAGPAARRDDWDALVEPMPFFRSRKHYLAVDIWADSTAEQLMWEGFAASKLRHLTTELQKIARAGTLKRLRNWPFPSPPYCAEAAAAAAEARAAGQKPEARAVGYYFGFDVDASRLRDGAKLDLKSCREGFIASHLEGAATGTFERAEGMHVEVTHCLFKSAGGAYPELPESVFEGRAEYGGSKAEAKQLQKAERRAEKAKEEALTLEGKVKLERALAEKAQKAAKVEAKVKAEGADGAAAGAEGAEGSGGAADGVKTEGAASMKRKAASLQYAELEVGEVMVVTPRAKQVHGHGAVAAAAPAGAAAPVGAVAVSGGGGGAVGGGGAATTVAAAPKKKKPKIALGRRKQ